MRERLTAAKESLLKMQKSNDQMDGNTSAAEEDEFIETFKSEIPEIYKNLELELK